MSEIGITNYITVMTVALLLVIKIKLVERIRRTRRLNEKFLDVSSQITSCILIAIMSITMGLFRQNFALALTIASLMMCLMYSSPTDWDTKTAKYLVAGMLLVLCGAMVLEFLNVMDSDGALILFFSLAILVKTILESEYIALGKINSNGV